MIRSFSLVAALLIGSGCSQQGRVIGSTAPELRQPPQIEVLFNHRGNSSYRSPLTGRWRQGDDLEQFLIEAIEGAQQEVLVAVQELTLPGIATALIAAQDRGLTVQVVLENSYSTPWSDQQPSHLPKHQRHRWHQLQHLADADGDGITTAEEARQGDAVGLLLQAGVPLLDDTEDGSSGSGLMHHKFVVIDNKTVITGSFNWSPSAAHTNDETLLVIHSPQLAKHFTREMDRLWNGAELGITPHIQRKLDRQKIRCGDGVERG